MTWSEFDFSWEEVVRVLQDRRPKSESPQNFERWRQLSVWLARAKLKNAKEINPGMCLSQYRAYCIYFHSNIVTVNGGQVAVLFLRASNGRSRRNVMQSNRLTVTGFTLLPTGVYVPDLPSLLKQLEAFLDGKRSKPALFVAACLSGVVSLVRYILIQVNHHTVIWELEFPLSIFVRDVWVIT
jgi:hypothetical protein